MKKNTDNHPLTEHRPPIEGRKRTEEHFFRLPKLDITMTAPGEKDGAVVTAENVELKIAVEVIDYVNLDTGETVEMDRVGGAITIKAESVLFTAKAQKRLPHIKFVRPNQCGVEFLFYDHKHTMPEAWMTHTRVVGGDEETGNFRLFGVELTGEIGDIII